jgi:hypothetical protein
LNRALPGANGRTVQWVMRGGPECA